MGLGNVMRKVIRNLRIAGVGLLATYGALKVVAKKRIEPASIDDDNPYINVEAAVSKCGSREVGMYEGKVKLVLDQILSFSGLVALSPVFVLISLAVYIDNPGPLFFTQKRVGKDKHFFYCHKFRSMRMDTPHDVPTHQLIAPEQYITRVGKVLRRTSMDELPQFWDIFRSKMSLIGPRPALWNQDDLVRERDKYGANDVMPGLTGLAQISGRDELEISDKARLDGEYVENQGFLMDMQCFFGTIRSVLNHDGVIEGGTGSIGKSRLIELVDPADVGFEDYGYLKHFNIDKNAHRKVLITGVDSYIGESFKAYCKRHYPNIECTTIDMIDGSWKKTDFSSYDTLFHVAGIAHADIGYTSVAEQEKYYEVNTDLAIETAHVAKEAGVPQFILMSSMIIYGRVERVDEHTVPEPQNFYGNSKWLADKGVRKLGDEKFKVAVLRPPMIYGKGSKGNYHTLSKFARRLPIFPKINNQRSMLYIENLCEFVGLLVLSGESGIYFPQNREYSSTSEIVKMIGKVNGHKIIVSRAWNWVVGLASHIPGKVSILTNKAFGTFFYDKTMSKYEFEYQRVGLKKSIRRTEVQ